MGAAWTPGTDAAETRRPVVVEAEDYGLWQGDQRLFAAYGNVRVTDGDITITADSLYYDVDGEEVFLEGNVVFRDGHNELKGKSLRYHVGRGEGQLESFEGIYRLDELGDPIFLFGERIHRNPERLLITRARVTTCEVGQPPYYFAAREVEIYPGDRITVRGVTFVEHGITLMYWPSLTISPKEQRSRFDPPRPGYNANDGWYVKWTHNYDFADDYGSLYVDYYQRRGLGVGIRHVYEDTSRRRSEVFGYTVNNPRGGRDYEAEWSSEWRLQSGLRGTAKVGYRSLGTGGPVDDKIWKAEASLNRNTSRSLFELVGKYRHERLVGRDDILELDASGRWVLRLSDDWNFSLRGSAFEMRTATRDTGRYAYLARLERSWGDYTLFIDVEQQLHPELADKRRDPRAEPSWKTMHRLPEVSLSAHKTLWGLPLTLRGSAGHFQEYPGDREDWRLATSAQLRGYTLPLTARSSLTARGSLLGYTYGRGQSQLGFDSRFTLTYRPWRSLRLTADYDYRRGWGETPFRFDEITPLETITPRAQWAQGAWNLMATSRYDLRTRRWGNAVGQIAYYHGSVDAQLTGSYNMQTSQWQEVVATVGLSPSEKHRIRMGAWYHVPTQRLTRLDVDGSIPIGSTWRLSASMIYHTATERFSRGFFKLTKDLGCREISIGYDHMDKEVWIEYQIFAFPMSRVRVGRSEEEDFLFESDFLRELLEE